MDPLWSVNSTRMISRRWFFHCVKLRSILYTLKCCLTSNFKCNSGSGGSSRAAGHTAVLTSVNRLGASNVQGPAMHVLLNERSRAHVQLTWIQTEQVSTLSSQLLIHPLCNCNLPLNQWTRGRGTPVTWHSRAASPPTDTSTTCCTTVIPGASGETWKLKMEFNSVYLYSANSHLKLSRGTLYCKV